MMTRWRPGAIRARVDGADQVPAGKPRKSAPRPLAGIEYDWSRAPAPRTTDIGRRALLWTDA